MNTEIRRSIFVILATCVDYMDAVEKLSKYCCPREVLPDLMLYFRLERDACEHDCLRVVLRCCTREKVYNPFYGLVAESLSKQSQGHRSVLCCWRNASSNNLYFFFWGGADSPSNLRFGTIGKNWKNLVK